MSGITAAAALTAFFHCCVGDACGNKSLIGMSLAGQVCLDSSSMSLGLKPNGVSEKLFELKILI